MSTGRKAQMQGDPTGQGAAGWPKGRTWALTDDPCKETKLQGPARRQGPPEAGSTDAWQVRTPEKTGTCALQVAPARLRAFASQIKTNSEAVGTTAPALPAEARTKAGVGVGLRRPGTGQA